MAQRKRPVTSVLTLQATVLVILTVAALAWVWQGLGVRTARIDAPLNALEIASQRAQDAVLLPFDYAADRSPDRIEQAREALAEAKAGVGVLRTLVPQASHSLEQARVALERVEAASNLVYQASAPQDATAQDDTATAEGLTALRESGDALQQAFTQVHAEINHQTALQERRIITGLLAITLGMLVVALTATLVTRWRVLANDRLVLQTIDSAANRVADVLGHAAAGDPDLPALPNDPLLDKLISSSARAIATLEDLRESIAHLRRSSSFIHDLIDALALAEDEAAIFQTAHKAAAVAYPSANFQVMVIDPDSGEVEPRVENVPIACDFQGTERCPAVLKGRTLHHLPEEPLARCPRLQDPHLCVTCSAIAVMGQTVALAQVAGYPPEAQFDDLDALSLAVGARLGVVRSLAERDQRAGTDPLTNLANRRMLNERLERLDQGELPYAIVAADLDHFKELNDTHGHAAGDACLELFAQVLRDASRGTDLPARTGGEEFVIVLPGAGVRAGLAVAMRIRSYLAQATRHFATPFTVSIGVAARPEHGDSSETVMRAADNALYDAKAAGRNAVVPARVGAALELVPS